MIQLKPGDVVSVLRVQQFGPDLRIPATVTLVTDEAFGARAIRGDFDNGGGHDLVWLEKSAKYRTWE